MGTLKTIEKKKIRFLMNFDYNNILGRLKFVLGKEASFFANIRVRQNDISWSSGDDIGAKSLSDASEIEKQTIRESIDDQIVKINNKIEKDDLIGAYAKQITTYPSEEFVYFTQVNGKYKIVLTGWGCLEDTKENHEIKKRPDISQNDNSISGNNQSNLSVPQSIMDDSTRIDSSASKQGTFINGNIKTNLHKEENKRSKKDILKSIILVLLAAFIALIIPIFLTGAANRFVADITGQWYLNGLSRIIITLFVAISTYSAAYILIRFSILRKSIVFNIVCFILTFVWSVLMGIAWIPD
jgi:hypothetical protein